MLGQGLKSEGLERGPGEDDTKKKLFDGMCEWLESSCEKEVFTLEELQSHIMMETRCEADCLYSSKRLKAKLIDRYGDHIFFGKVRGRKNVICFKEMCSYIVSDKWYSERNSYDKDDSDRIVKAAAKLIAAEILDIESNMEVYPSPEYICSDIGKTVPPLLSSFLQKLIPSELKSISYRRSYCASSQITFYVMSNFVRIGC